MMFGVVSFGFSVCHFIKITNRHRFTIKFASKVLSIIYLPPSPSTPPHFFFCTKGRFSAHSSVPWSPFVFAIFPFSSVYLDGVSVHLELLHSFFLMAA